MLRLYSRSCFRCKRRSGVQSARTKLALRRELDNELERMHLFPERGAAVEVG